MGVGWGLQGLAIERLGRCKGGSNDLHEGEKRTDGKKITRYHLFYLDKMTRRQLVAASLSDEQACLS